MNNIYPYVYKIVDKLTGEFYIGSRHQNVKLKRTPEEDFLKYYFSSGSIEPKLRNDSSNFDCSIIFRSGEPEVAYWYEQLLIRENIKNPLCTNRHYIDPDTGAGIFSMAGKPSSRKGHHLSSETKTKISESRKGKLHSEDTKRKMSDSQIGRVHSVESKKKISNSKKGKPGKLHSELSKSKISSSLKGKQLSDEHRAKLSFIAKNRSPETLVKISEALRKKEPRIVTCPHCNKSGAANNMSRWHFDNCRALSQQN